ncbi:CDP-alcohol phosphatidyltransferase family protein [Kaarinaea lacus]
MKARDIPNIISIIRIVLVVPFIALMLRQEFTWALVLFFVAGVSDGIDGYLAKRNNWTSRLGSILDPLADKLLLVSSFVSLAWLNIFPVWLVVAVLLRDVIIIGGALAFHFMVGRYEMEPTIISKINTFFQIMLVLSTVFSQGLYPLPPMALQALVYIVLGTTILSGADYIYTWGRRTYYAKKQQQTSQ